MRSNRRFRTWQTAATLSLCGVVGVVGARYFAEPARAQAASAGALEVGDDGPLTQEQKIVHVLNRLGYGPRPGDIERVRALGIDKYIDQQLHPERIDDSSVDRKLAGFQMLSLSGDALAEMYFDRNAAAKDVQTVQREIAKDAPVGAASAMDGSGAAMALGTQSAMAPQTQAMTAAPNGSGGPLQGKYAQDMATATPAERDQMRNAVQALAAKQFMVARTNIQLSTAKTIRAVESERQLQEVLVDFWGNHFNIDTRKGPCATLKAIDDRDVIRPYALGKFRDLLGASAKSPAMLYYLDNFQSTSPAALPQRRRLAAAQTAPKAARAGGLNENYGREVMELHTLGVDGGYTQKDVTEVARCFTGWGLKRIANTNPGPMATQKYRIGGEFEFHPYLHDHAEKVVLGHRIAAGGGIDDGEQVLDILASAPATMQHVSYELCQRFVADKPPVSLVNKCVSTWQKTDGDIREIVRTIVTSPEFFSRAAYRQKLKSPFEYAVSAVRALGGSYDPALIARAYRPVSAGSAKNPYAGAGANTLVGQVSTMGQPIFQYQAPTGYPEDSHKWKSTGALISRLNFSLALSYGKLTEVKFPDNDEDVAGLNGPSQIISRLANEILHGDISASTRDVILRESTEAQSSSAAASVSASSDLALLRRATALMLGSPEFQRR